MSQYSKLSGPFMTDLEAIAFFSYTQIFFPYFVVHLSLNIQNTFTTFQHHLDRYLGQIRKFSN